MKERTIRSALRLGLGRTGDHACARHAQVDYEHGQWWVTCRRCGRQWSVVETNTVAGLAFELVTEGKE